jgi:predicted dehydrogenase
MKSEKKVGFAVIGLGAIARMAVLPAFRRSKHARLVALVSSDRRKAAAWTKEFHAESAYSTDELQECLSHPLVEAVYIATPPGTHLDFTVKAAQAGKHVLCEKPLAADSRQSAQMVQACEARGVRLMTAYRKYFEPSAVFLKGLVQSEKLGRIDTIHTSFSELHVPGKSLEWLLDRQLAGGGPLMDLGVYCVNTARWILEQDPVEACAFAWKRDASRFRDVEEGISFRLQFPGGCVVQGSSSYGAVLSSFLFIEGSKGWACLAPAFPFDEERNLTGKIGGKGFARKFKIVDEFAPELDAFSLAIRRDRPLAPDGVQGHRDLQILEAIYDSAKIEMPIAIRYRANHPGSL